MPAHSPVVLLRTGLTAVPGSVPRAVLLGVGSAIGVWLLRLAIRRRRNDGGTTGVAGAQPLQPDGDGHAIVRREGSVESDVAFAIPTPWTDRSSVPVGYVELYAVEIGLVGGGFLAWFASLAVVDPLVGVLAGATIGVFSFWRIRSMAVPTVRRATVPWLVSTVVGAAIGAVLFL